MKTVFTLASTIFLLCVMAAPSQALTVACVNCSDNWTQQMDRVTNLEQLKNMLNTYHEAIQQTQQQIALVQSNLQQYQNMIQNTVNLPKNLLNQVKGQFNQLAQLTNKLNLQKGDYLAMGQVFDEIYPRLELLKNITSGAGVKDVKERVVLDVPFEEKNQAKAAGAKWDRDNKVWVADPGTDLTRLGQWIPEKEPEPEKVLAATEEFAKVLEKAGFQLDGPPVMNGSIQRVAIADGKPNARDGAYYGTLKGEQPSGWLKNHKTGEYQAWISSGQEMTAAGKQSQKANETAKRQSKREMAEMAAMIKWESSQDVAEEFASQIDGMTSTSDLLKNPFLEVAGVNAVGGVRRDDDGNLLVPAVNSEGKLLTMAISMPWAIGRP